MMAVERALATAMTSLAVVIAVARREGTLLPVLEPLFPGPLALQSMLNSSINFYTISASHF
jgi:hypothetical protein